MYPPIFEVCTASSEVRALLDDDGTTKLFLFGLAPQSVKTPYAVWQTIGGLPENYITNTPDIDRFAIQIDVYADSAATAREVAAALRDAIEPHAHVVGWRGGSRDPDTRNYRYSFDVEWFVKR
ncbi:MAG TPA: DUF3168 domain-containing protein [Arenicellales bacterium]|nr:DUF3168 domain-containing protein [Arenicellales bacterium]